MKSIIRMIMRRLGWQRLLRMTWEAIHPDLEAYVAKTPTQLDDVGLKIIDDIVDMLTEDQV